MTDRLAVGRRDRVITIEQLTESAGASAFPLESWSTLVANVFASKVDAPGRERFVADEIAAAFDTTWQVEYRADIDPELVDVPKTRRVVYEGRRFDIVAAQQIGRRAGVQLQTIASSRQP